MTTPPAQPIDNDWDYILVVHRRWPEGTTKATIQGLLPEPNLVWFMTRSGGTTWVKYRNLRDMCAAWQSYKRDTRRYGFLNLTVAEETAPYWRETNHYSLWGTYQFQTAVSSLSRTTTTSAAASPPPQLASQCPSASFPTSMKLYSPISPHTPASPQPLMAPQLQLPISPVPQNQCPAQPTDSRPPHAPQQIQVQPTSRPGVVMVTKASGSTPSAAPTSTSTTSSKSLDEELVELAPWANVFVWSEFKPEEEVGEGTYGRVLKGTFGDGGMPVAVKVLEDAKSASTMDDEIRETYLLQRCCCPGVVQCLGICVGAPTFSIVFELMECDLFEVIHERHLVPSVLWPQTRPLNSERRLWISHTAAMGLSHVQDAGIIHRDVKAANFLLDSCFHCKVADLGFGVLLPPNLPHNQPLRGERCGTFPYMPPELLIRGELYKSCDTYSFGLFLWELFTEIVPFADKPDFTTKAGMCTILKKGERPELGEKTRHLIPPKLEQLIKDCWHEEPTSRPSMAAVDARIKDILLELIAPVDKVREAWKQMTNNTIAEPDPQVSWDTFIGYCTSQWQNLKTELCDIHGRVFLRRFNEVYMRLMGGTASSQASPRY
ncbi:TKL family protein kinase [Pelomyxa schiedti]|nr:TKL family protein kinase [Pelomyxa schiedti]